MKKKLLIAALLVLFPTLMQAQKYGFLTGQRYCVVEYAHGVTQNGKTVSRGDTLRTLARLLPRACSDCFKATLYDRNGKFLGTIHMPRPDSLKGLKTLGTRGPNEQEEADNGATLKLTPSQHFVDAQYQIRWSVDDHEKRVDLPRQQDGNILIPADLFQAYEGSLVVDILVSIKGEEAVPLYNNLEITVKGGKFLME